MDSYSSFMELEWATYIHVHMHGLRSFVAAIITWLFGFCPCLHRLIPKPGDEAIV